MTQIKVRVVPTNTGEPITPEELTPQQKQQWEDTMSLMAWTCPGFRHIFYRLLANNNGKYTAVPTRQVPIAATDGKNILINPDKYFEYELRERVFIAAHEVVHNVYGDVELLHRCAKAGQVPMHDGTSLPFKEGHMQRAMDFRINALLAESKIGKMPKEGCLDKTISKDGSDSVLDIYRKLYEDDPDGGDGDGGFDLILEPGTSTGQSAQSAAQRNSQQWAVEIAAAQTLEQVRSQGKMAGGLKRMFKELLEPEIPWTEHIRAICARRLGSGSYNWRRPDRRHITRDLYMPSRSGNCAGWLVIWGDTSGSIGSAEMERYLAELAGIIEDVNPRRLTILWCDAAIHDIDEVQDVGDLLHIKARGVGGGGGTAVMPIFEWIADHTEVPDMMIAFTDGYCDPFPSHQPSYPVIWASTTDKQYPWGEVVRIMKGH